ncbi:MAG TPA: hypothetical protein DIV79_10785 [Opitutae bacterium]|nr:hypothetical protein [Opitutaceae bacterium]HCR30491.1 hypothetical protein [Opitutae bacterium]
MARSRTREPIALYNRILDPFIEGYVSAISIYDEEIEAIPYFYLMQRIWMRANCCKRFIDWSSSFMSPQSWKHSVANHKYWARKFCQLWNIWFDINPYCLS